MARRKWTPELTTTLVSLYELEPVLYQVNNPSYHNKGLRALALQSIVKELEVIAKEKFTTEEVAKKINNLRTQFLDCFRQVRKGNPSGSGGVVKTTWWLFDSLQFLIPYCNKKSTVSKLPIERPATTDCYEMIIEKKEDDTESFIAFNDSTYDDEDVIFTPTPKKRQLSESSSNDSAIIRKKSICNSESELPQDIKSFFGFLGQEMKTLPQDAIDEMKWEMIDMLKRKKQEHKK